MSDQFTRATASFEYSPIFYIICFLLLPAHLSCYKFVPQIQESTYEKLILVLLVSLHTNLAEGELGNLQMIH